MVKTAARQYLREFGLAMTGYTVVVIGSISLIEISPSSAWWRIPLAITPIIPATFGIIAYMRFVNRMDELQRRIQFEGIAFAFGVAGILTFSYGFLENVGFPHINMLWVFPFMIALWGIGTAIAMRRYQ